MLNTTQNSILSTFKFADYIITPKDSVRGFLPYLNTIKSNKQAKILVDDETARANFLASGTSGSATDPFGSNTVGNIVLKPKRINTQIEISNQLLNEIENAPYDIMAHFEQIAASRIQRQIELQIVNSGWYTDGSETDTQLQLLTKGNGNIISAHPQSDWKLDYKDAKSAFAQWVFNGGDVTKGFWIFGDTTIQVINAYGEDVITYDNLPPGAAGRLFGMPIFAGVSFATADNKHMAAILVDPSAYTVLLGDTVVKQVKADRTQMLRGATVFNVDQFVDGKVLNAYLINPIEFAS